MAQEGDDEVEIVQEKNEDLRKRKNKEPNAEVNFDVAPIKAICKHCRIEVTTFVMHEMHPIFPLAACAIMFIFGYLSLIICPFVYLVT